MIRVAALLPLLSACGIVDDVDRTSFRLDEIRFQVRTDAGDALLRERPDLEEPVDLSENILFGGVSELQDVRIDRVEVSAYANSLGVGIERVQFIAAPVSLDTRAVFASVAGIGPNEVNWPEIEKHAQGIDQLAALIADQRAPFLVQAAITLDVLDGYVTQTGGILDVGLRIVASALAVR